jgi:hypothetical protein
MISYMILTSYWPRADPAMEQSNLAFNGYHHITVSYSGHLPAIVLV